MLKKYLPIRNTKMKQLTDTHDGNSMTVSKDKCTMRKFHHMDDVIVDLDLDALG